MSLRDEIALVDLYISELLLQLDGNNDNKIWRQVMRLITKRRVLVESERKHRVQRNYMLTVEEALALMGLQLHLYHDAVRKHVGDEEVARTIARDISQDLARRFQHGDSQTTARRQDRPRNRKSTELPRHIKEQLRTGLAPMLQDLIEGTDAEC